MKNVLILLTATLAVTSHLAHAETVGEALKKCSNEENALKRLVCYDRLVKDMNQYAGLDKQASVSLPPVRAEIAPAPIAQQQSEAVAEANKQLTDTVTETVEEVATADTAKPSSDFGLEQKKLRETADRIYAEIGSVTQDSRKKMIITFTDGQVWRQSDSGRLRLSEGDQVYVQRGAVGAFYLGKESVNKRIRVRRSK